MPELPEVEVTRRSFASEITGAQILAAVPGKPLRWPLGCSPARLVGQRVQGVRRRGKYLLVDLSAGLLLVHLGMSGSLRFAPSLPPAGTHDHFDLVTSQGVLRLNDPRRFGAVVFAESQDAAVAQKLLGGLGLEPLSDAFTFEALRAGLRPSRTPMSNRCCWAARWLSAWATSMRRRCCSSRAYGRRGCGSDWRCAYAPAPPGDQGCAGIGGGAGRLDAAEFFERCWQSGAFSAGSAGVRAGRSAVPGLRQHHPIPEAGAAQ